MWAAEAGPQHPEDRGDDLVLTLVARAGQPQVRAQDVHAGLPLRGPVVGQTRQGVHARDPDRGLVVAELGGRAGEALVEQLGALALLLTERQQVRGLRDPLLAVVHRERDDAAEAGDHRETDLEHVERFGGGECDALRQLRPAEQPQQPHGRRTRDHQRDCEPRHHRTPHRPLVTAAAASLPEGDLRLALRHPPQRERGGGRSRGGQVVDDDGRHEPSSCRMERRRGPCPLRTGRFPADVVPAAPEGGHPENRLKFQSLEGPGWCP